MPITWWTFLIATLAIAGIPPLSGFFSKDEILANAFEFGHVVWFVLAIGAMMTSFYMFRLLYLTFFKNFRGTVEQKSHLHESPAVMTIPLILLAILAAIGGLINIPAIFGGSSWLSGFLAPVFADAVAISGQPVPISHATEWILMATTFAGCLAMIFWAWRCYVKQEKGLLADDSRRSFLVQLVYKKFYIDELYDFMFVKPSLWMSRFLHQVVELRLIDRMVNGVGQLVVWTGSTLRYVQTGNVGFYMFIMILGIILILFFNILT